MKSLEQDDIPGCDLPPELAAKVASIQGDLDINADEFFAVSERAKARYEGDGGYVENVQFPLLERLGRQRQLLVS